jgi:hypothetical protein
VISAALQRPTDPHHVPETTIDDMRGRGLEQTKMAKATTSLSRISARDYLTPRWNTPQPASMYF